MDPRDRLPPFVNGVECAVCGSTVPLEGIRVLARREDLAFVELACAGCRSESLGIVVDVADDAAATAEPGGSARYGEFLSADDERFHEALPIDADDLARVRAILARRGLEGLVDGPPAGDGGARP